MSTMTPAMALSFFASVIKSGEPWTATCQQALDEARAHLAQPAPAVDVDTVRDVIAECERNMHGIGITGLRRMAGKLTRAIGDAQEDGE